MNYMRFALWSGIALSVQFIYGVLDHFVLEVDLPHSPSSALIRVAGFVACLLFVSNVFVKRGLEDLRVHRATARTANNAPDAESNNSGNAVQEKDDIRFVYSRRYVRWAWATAMAPLAMIGLSIFQYPGN
jgi:hypothetical protein